MTAGPSDDGRERYPVIGAVMLDAMAEIAGPAWAPGYELAWSTAFEIVLGATLGGLADRELADAA